MGYKYRHGKVPKEIDESMSDPKYPNTGLGATNGHEETHQINKHSVVTSESIKDSLKTLVRY